MGQMHKHGMPMRRMHKTYISLGRLPKHDILMVQMHVHFRLIGTFKCINSPIIYFNREPRVNTFNLNGSTENVINLKIEVCRRGGGGDGTIFTVYNLQYSHYGI